MTSWNRHPGELLLSVVAVCCCSPCTLGESAGFQHPKDITQLWAGYDARALPLDIEAIEDRSENGFQLQRLYFTSEVAEGKPVRIYAITGAPSGQGKQPGILHIHGGGQTASMDWVRYWSTRGFAVVSIDWCGEVAGRSDYARWGRVKANMMKDGQDRAVRPSVRASPWYHWAVASRRALTLLEQLPGVDRARLGIFGVSMGAQLTWMVAGVDERVRTAVPIYGCGWNTYLGDVHSGQGYGHPAPPDIDLWRATMEPETYARYVTCPVLQLSATNDFHTHMERFYDSLARVSGPTWQSFTPRYSHHLEKEQGQTLERWMIMQLKGGEAWPLSPRVSLQTAGDRLHAVVQCDDEKNVVDVEVFSNQGTKRPQTRFWRSLGVSTREDGRRASVPLFSRDTVRVFANVTYSGGYTLSSLEAVMEDSALPAGLSKEQASPLIDDFSHGVSDWTFGPAYTDPHISWSYLQAAEGPAGTRAMTLNPAAWGAGPIKYVVGTHKVGDACCSPPADARFAFVFRSAAPATLTVHVLVDQWGPQFKEYVADVTLKPSDEWQPIEVSPEQCVTKSSETLKSFAGVDRIDFVGQSPPGQPPAFAQVRWTNDSIPAVSAKESK